MLSAVVQAKMVDPRSRSVWHLIGQLDFTSASGHGWLI